MALILCPECSNTVSNTAAACPHCGAPIARAAAERVAIGTPLSTIQQASKRLKMHIVVSALLWWLGVIWLIFAIVIASQSTGATPSFNKPCIIIFIATAWYILTKLRIWWHHK